MTSRSDGDDGTPNPSRPLSAPLILLQSVIGILPSVFWPIAVIYSVHVFREPVTRLIDRAQSLTAESPVGKLSLAVVAQSAASAQAAAEAKDVPPAQASRNIAKAFENSGMSARRFLESRILWVSDEPQNDVNLLNALQTLGIRYYLARSSAEAEKQVTDGRFDVIVTDMGRPENEEAGLILIKSLRQMSISTPVIVYSAYWGANKRDQAETIGADLISNDPSEIYTRIIQLIQGR